MTHKRQMGTLIHMSTATQENIPPVTLPWRLRIALDHGGMTREEMAEHLDVSVATLSRWMHGKGAAPKRIYLKEWAELTDVSLKWLASGVGGATNPPDDGGKVQPNALARLTDAKRRRTGGNAHTIGVCVGALAA